MSWSPSQRQLITCSRDKTLLIHSLAKDSTLRDEALEFLCGAVLSGHTQGILFIAHLALHCFYCNFVILDVKNIIWHPSQDLVISASYDNTIRLWTPWASESISTSQDEEEYDSDWHCAYTLEGHLSTVWSVSFSKTGIKQF